MIALYRSFYKSVEDRPAMLILGVSPGFARGRAFHGYRLNGINPLETASRRYNHSPMTPCPSNRKCHLVFPIIDMGEIMAYDKG